MSAFENLSYSVGKNRAWENNKVDIKILGMQHRMVRGDLRSPRTTSLDTTRPSRIFYRLLLN
jgi:hypothetical protein